jgi:uncharacterized repeat protein (TIGR03803 family)
MRHKQLSISLTLALAVFTLTMLGGGAVRAAAQTETVLLDLTLDGGVGGDPQAGLISDASGNLYGTTAFGGPRSGGTVFELSPTKSGTWTSKVLHAFITGIDDGQRPQAGVTFDSAGNLYGTTYWGGVDSVGTVFELMPQANGSWKEKQLHSFDSHTEDGQNPEAGVVFDSAGNLYGTTLVGGSLNLGTVFELMPQANGEWKERQLHSFQNNTQDGGVPLAGLVFDQAGNFYGATSIGGAYDAGTIFELTASAGGRWIYRVVYSFNRSGDGNFPYGTPILDAAGNLYGTTTQGGLYGWGTVYELSPTGEGHWVETILHNFNNDATEGYYPYSALIFDAAGNLYGTTEAGGAYSGGTVIGGTVFELSPGAGGSWTETVLHNFGNGDDGNAPLGCLIFDAAGNLYGTSDEGGTTGYGTVFEVTP